MADSVILAGGQAARASAAFRTSVSSGISVDVGMPLAAAASPGTGAVFARANAAGTAGVLGLAATAGEFPGSVDLAVTGQVLTLTVAQWFARTGEAGGLTPGATYYLSGSAGALITKTAPVSGFVTAIGVASSSTTLVLQIVPPVPLV